MRITNAVSYEEPRDAIAQDWSNYMLSAFPKSKWIFIPNMGEESVKYFKQWNLNVLILSGGDDIGIYPKRDETEFRLLKHCLTENIPIIGICRGMQLIHTYFNGEILRGKKEFIEKHRATTHSIRVDSSIKCVNSYHSNRIVEKTLNNSFKIIARCEKDDTIEAIENEHLIAFMWHPERDNIVKNWNKDIINKFLKKWKVGQ